MNQDVLQSYIGFSEAGMMATTVYLSVLTAYLIAAYTIGSKLNTFQLYTLSALFITFALAFTYSTFGLMTAAVSLYNTNVENPTGVGSIQKYVALIIAICELAGIIAALAFMSNVRRTEND